MGVCPPIVIGKMFPQSYFRCVDFSIGMFCVFHCVSVKSTSIFVSSSRSSPGFCPWTPTDPILTADLPLDPRCPQILTWVLARDPHFPQILTCALPLDPHCPQIFTGVLSLDPHCSRSSPGLCPWMPFPPDPGAEPRINCHIW